MNKAGGFVSFAYSVYLQVLFFCLQVLVCPDVFCRILCETRILYFNLLCCLLHICEVFSPVMKCIGKSNCDNVC